MESGLPIQKYIADTMISLKLFGLPIQGQEAKGGDYYDLYNRICDVLEMNEMIGVEQGDFEPLTEAKYNNELREVLKDCLAVVK